MKRKIPMVMIVILIAIGVAVYKKPAKVPVSDIPNNGVSKGDLIRVTSPRPGETISSPVTITGEARGTWFFEASFPIMITDWDGRIIGEGHAEATSDWMTENFVPFTAKITFTSATSTYSKKGYLILKKDNPSGLPEHDDAFEMPVIFK